MVLSRADDTNKLLFLSSEIQAGNTIWSVIIVCLKVVSKINLPATKVFPLTVTVTSPVPAKLGVSTVRDVALALRTVAFLPLNETISSAALRPNPEPAINTSVESCPSVGSIDWTAKGLECLLQFSNDNIAAI